MNKWMDELKNVKKRMKYFVRVIHFLDQCLTSELTANEWRGWKGMKCLRFSLHNYFKTTTWKKKTTKKSLSILRCPLNLLKFSKWKQSDSKPGKQNCKSQVVGCLPVGSKPRNWRKIWEMSPYVGISLPSEGGRPRTSCPLSWSQWPRLPHGGCVRTHRMRLRLREVKSLLSRQKTKKWWSLNPLSGK